MYETLARIKSVQDSVLIHRPAHVVYEALVTPHILDAWWTKGTIIDLRVGGKFRWFWQNWGKQRIAAEARGQFIAIVPNQKLIWRWINKNAKDGDDLSQSSLVVINLDCSATGTIVSVNQSSSNEKGLIPGLDITWSEPLSILQFYLEHATAYHMSLVDSPKYLSHALIEKLLFLS